MKHKKYAVFTMDVEPFCDTECVKNSSFKTDADFIDGFDEYIKLLDKHGIKSTLFTVGDFAPKIAERLKTHIKNGHRLALHNYKHIAPMDMPLAKFKDRIKGAKENLSKMFETEIEGFRAPFFSLDRERIDALRELGFRYDSSHLGFTKARHTAPLNLDGFDACREGIFCKNGFFEFEMSKQKVFGKPFPISGGGYVRLGNWEFIKGLIYSYLKKNNYYVFYLHPFELTKNKIPFIKDLKSYDKFYLSYGIRSYAGKIEQIIKMLKKCGYEFVTFEELSEIMAKERA